MPTPNKKETILTTAELCFLEKDYPKTTIAEIARRSGVTASVLYHYHKNKEDLLFSVIGRRFDEINQNLSEHLEGIIDPLSKIKKIIWFHLNYFGNNPEWARLFMFNGLRNRDFYRHPSYQKLRYYSSFVVATILEGIQEGVFRKDLNVSVTRDLIGGILDNEVLSWLILQDIEKMTSAVDSILDLLKPALVLSDTDSLKEVPDKRERINLAAKELFSAKGYERTTMLDITKQAGIAEGSVYDYFKSKEEILFLITEGQLAEIETEFEDIFNITHPARKLERLVRVYFSSTLSNRDFLKTYYIQIFFSDRFWELTSFKISLENGYGVEQILKEGKEAGVFRSDTSFRALRSIIIGGLGHMAFRWVFVEGEIKNDPRRSDKTRDINDAIAMILRMVT